MTQLVRLWLAIPEPIRDALWPSIIWTQEEAAQEETRRARRAVWEDAIIQELTSRPEEELQEAVTKCKEILDTERERGASVERRLTGFLTLSSIGAAAGIVTLLQQLLGETHQPAPYQRLVSVGAIALTIYIVIQVVCSSLAAVRGLKRRPYLEPLAAGLLPYPGESTAGLAQRQMREYLAAARDHYANNSGKVEEMAIVHVALRNLFVAVLVLMPLLLVRYSLGARAVCNALKVIQCNAEKLIHPPAVFLFFSEKIF